MDDSNKQSAQKKRIGDLLVEAGIVKPEEAPRGLEFAQKATAADSELVAELKSLIDEQGLALQFALRALTLAKQKHCSISEALISLGWRSHGLAADVTVGVKSAFDTSELDQIGTRRTKTTQTMSGLASGLKVTSNPESPKSTGTKITAWSLQKAQGEAPDMVPDEDAAVPERRSETKLHMQPDEAPDLEGAEVSPATLTNVIAFPSPEQRPAQPAPSPKMPPPLPTSISSKLPPPLPSSVVPAALSVEEAPPPPAPVSKTQEIIASGDSAYAEHAYEEAENFYLRALAILERAEEDDPLQLSELFVKLGRTCLQLSEFGRSESHLTKALKLREGFVGHEDILTAECLDFLAELYDVQSQYLEAEHYYLSSLGVKEKILQPGDSEIVRSLKKLVAVSKHRGKQPEEKLSGQLLTEAGIVDAHKLEEGLCLASERSLPIGRALISLNYLNEDDLESVLQAQLLLREGTIPGYLAVRALRIASEQRIEFIAALKEIGIEPDDASKRGLFDLLSAARDLVHAERELQPDHRDVATLCVKLGDLYMEHQRHQNASDLYRRALGIFEGYSDTNNICEALTRLGHLQFRVQKYDESEASFTRLVDLYESQGVEDDIKFFNALESLAAVHYVRQNFKEAGRLYQLSINNKERLLGPEHPSLITPIQGRANSFYALQRFADAEKLYSRAMELNERVFGPNNQQNGVLANTVGDMFFSQARFQDAQAQYSRGLECLSNSANPDVWLFTSLLLKTAKCFVQLEDDTRAEIYFNHFLQARIKAGTADATEMADPLETYALVLQNLDRTEQAFAMLERANAIRMRG